MFMNFFKNKEIELAEKVVKDNPDNIIKLNILGKLYVENNFFNEAIVIFEKILRIDENYLPALESLSKCYLLKKQYLKAFRTLKFLYSKNRNDSHVKTMFFSLENAPCDIEAKIEIIKGLLEFENRNDLQEKLAENYYESGQFIKSANIYENILGVDENPKYLIKLYEIYEKIEKYSHAAIALERLMITDEFNSFYAEKLANVYFKEKRLEEAKGIYELLIQSNPQNSKIYNEQIAKIYLEQDNPQEALIATQNAIDEDNYSVEAKFLQAQALIENSDFEGAIEFLREFYCDPIDKKTEKQIIDKIISTCILYSQKLRKERNFPKAIDALTPALRYDDSNKDIYIELSKISEDIKDFSAAKEYMKIAESL